MIPYFNYYKISICSIDLYIWGIFAVLGFLIGYLYVLKKAKNKGIGSCIIIDLATCVLLGGLLGARFFYLIYNPNYFLVNFTQTIKVWNGGMSMFGGVAGCFIAVFLYFKFKKLTKELFLQISDLAVAILPLSLAVIRIGCLLINDHQGKTTDLPWGIVWPDGVIRHPVALYLIVADLVIFFIIKFIMQYRQLKSGELSLVFIILYFGVRFALDFTRSTGTLLSDPTYSGFFLNQWLAFLIVLVTLVYWCFNKYFFKNKQS